jgi:hypothetical protein
MELSPERIVLANPFKTRIIAEAQIKTTRPAEKCGPTIISKPI